MNTSACRYFWLLAFWLFYIDCRPSSSSSSHSRIDTFYRTSCSKKPIRFFQVWYARDSVLRRGREKSNRGEYSAFRCPYTLHKKCSTFLMFCSMQERRQLWSWKRNETIGKKEKRKERNSSTQYLPPGTESSQLPCLFANTPYLQAHGAAELHWELQWNLQRLQNPSRNETKLVQGVRGARSPQQNLRFKFVTRADVVSTPSSVRRTVPKCIQ